MIRRILLALVLIGLTSTAVTAASPAAAADGMRVFPDKETSELGNPVRFTAVLSGYDPEADEGGEITFQVDKDSSGPITVGSVDELQHGASWTYTRSKDQPSGSYAVRAVFTHGENPPGPSGSAQHTWTGPSRPPPQRLDLTTATDRSTVGEQAPFTATVTGGESIAGLRVNFVASRNGDVVNRDSDTTGEGGRAFYSYGNDTPGVDVVVATIDQEGGASDSRRHIWVRPVPPPVLSLSPPAQTVKGGGFCIVRASLTQDGKGLDERALNYTVTNDKTGRRLSESVVTDGNGGAQIQWASPPVGIDTLSVVADDGKPATASCTVPAKALTLALVPAQSDSLVKTPFTIEATLLDNGEPVVGRELTLTAHHSKTRIVDRVLPSTTAEGGKALFTWTRRAAGVDSVTATAGDEVRASATHTWRSTPEPGRLQVVATPERATAQTGTSTVVNAVVRLGGRRESGVAVEATAEMAGQPVTRPRGLTDDRGRVRLTYSRPVAGEDRVTVRATADGKTASDVVRRTWTTKTVPSHRVPTITLSPDAAASQVGDQFRVTAVVRADGVLLPGAVVSFRATRTQDPANPRTGTATTNARGEAVFDHTRGRPGPEQIQATTTVDRRTVTARVSHRWSAKPVKPLTNPTIDVGPGNVRPGRDLTVGGTGCPPGVQVTLFLTAPGSAPVLLGRTFADAAGTYRMSQPMPEVPLNRYRVTSSCGTDDGAVLDVVGSEEAGASGSRAAGTATVVLLFFTLLGNAVIKLRSSLG